VGEVQIEKGELPPCLCVAFLGGFFNGKLTFLIKNHGSEFACVNLVKVDQGENLFF
jgi:hypothetical protein